MVTMFFTIYTVLQIFINLFAHIFSKREKTEPLTFLSQSSIEYLFLYFIYYLTTKIKFILSSITSGLEFWSVNHTSVYENSELNGFRNINFVSEISNSGLNNLFQTNVYTVFQSC